MWGFRPTGSTINTQPLMPPVADPLEMVPPPLDDPPCSCYRRHWTDGSWRADLDPYCLIHGVVTAPAPCPMHGCLRALSHIGAHGPVVTV